MALYIKYNSMKHLKYLYRKCSTTLSNLDLDYYCNPKNLREIEENIKMRKGVGDINHVLEAYNIINLTPIDDNLFKTLRDKFNRELNKLPNKTHPVVQRYTDPYIVHEINQIIQIKGHKPLEFDEITRRLNLARTDKLGPTCGHKSYYFLGELSELEEAIIKYTVTTLLKDNFNFVSVPDIISSNILENCGLIIDDARTKVYSLDADHYGPDLCLSGTAEMPIAGSLEDSIFMKCDLPIKLAAVSRCYRGETSNLTEERGVYRVHQFTKVEMFAVTTPEGSEEMLEYLRTIQEKIFSPLGFHMRVLDMPPQELGAPAYRKYDIEAWMPGRKSYGEISSCSNCTDYQSRRLNIQYNDNNKVEFAHTLNGTACAIPRMLITLLETHQHPKGKIFIPEVLQPFMNGKAYIHRNVLTPELKLSKIKKHI